MSAGSSGGEILARAKVAIDADTSSFDTAMEMLPAKSRKEAAKAIKAIQDEMKSVKLQIGAQFTSSGGSLANIKALDEYQKKLAKSMEDVKRAAINQARATNMATAGAATGYGSATNKLQVFAQTLDDLQYVPEQGLRPILNNIVQLSPALGVAGLAVQALITHWDTLAKLFGQGHVKTQAEEMEELRKKTSLTADEAERLKRATAVEEKVKEVRAGKPEEEQKTESAITKAIIEAGARDVAAGVLRVAPELVDQRGDAAVAKREREGAKAELESVKANAGENTDPNAIPRAEAQLLEADLKLAAARKKTAEELADSGALPGLFPGGLKQLRDIVDQDPTKFGPKGFRFGLDLERSSTESRKAEAEANRFVKVQEEAAKDRAKDDERTIHKDDLAMAAEESARQTQDFIEQQRRQRARQAGAGLGSRYRNSVLADVALGRKTDDVALGGRVANDLKATGRYTDADIKHLVPTIVDDLLKGVKGDVQERSNATGIDAKTAAYQEVAKSTSDAMAAAHEGSSTFTTFEGAYHRLQEGVRTNPYEVAIADSTKATADTNKAILAEIMRGRQADGKGVLAGRP